MQSGVWGRILGLSCLLLACGKGSVVPEVPTGGAAPVLSVHGEGKGKPGEGPLRVSYFAPVGEVAVQAELSLAFDRPMVALGRNVSADAVLELTPKLAGKARWLGSQTLLFEPSAPLPSGTEFQVRVRSDVTALDGKRLAEPVSWTFSTPALAVERVSPDDGEGGQLPERAFELTFNAPVVLAEVKKHAHAQTSATDGTIQEIETEISYPDEKEQRVVRVRPVRKLRLGEQITLELGAELRGVEGPRPLGSVYRTRFSVYGPLRIADLAPCGKANGRCAPGGGVSIHFTNPVSAKKAIAALRASPAVSGVSMPVDDYETDWLYLGYDFAPLASYTLSFEGELKDVYGNALEGPRALSVRTGPYEPHAYFPVDGDLVHAAPDKTSLPLQVRNLKTVHIALSRLTADDIEPLASGRVWAPKGKAPPMLNVAGPGPSERRVMSVDLSSVLSNGKGVVLARVQRHGSNAQKDTLARTLLAFTDVAVSFKAATEGGVVWVTSLSTAKSIAGANIRVEDCGKTVASGQSDAQGMLRFALKKAPECELFVLAEKDGDLSFAHQYAGLGPWDLSPNAQGDGHTEQAFVFADRGVYRPGETVRLKGILRARSAEGLLPASGTASLRVADSLDREIERTEVKLSALGTFSHSLRVPGSVALGPLSLELSHAGQSFYDSVQIAEFRRAEIEAEASCDRESYVRGESALFKVRGKYLFGAPLANQRLFYSTMLLERDVKPEGERYDAFVFGDDTRYLEDITPPSDSGLTGGEGKLDARGEYAQKVPLEFPLEAGAAVVEIEATVEGMGGASAVASSRVTVTPGAFMVGVKPNAQLAEANHPLAISVFAAKLDGKSVRGQDVTLNLVRRSYYSEPRVGAAGQREFEWQHRDEAVGSCQVNTRDEAVSCEVTPKQPGLHLLRAEAHDAKGRVIRAALPLYVYGKGDASWGEDNGPVLKLKSDRTRYRQGDVAKVLVTSPFAEAEALITVEREGVISVERKHLTGYAATIDVQIDKRFVPNAFVSVLLVRPKVAAHGADDGRPDYRAGTVELLSDVSDKHLRVKVTPDAAEKRPGDMLKASFDVRDGKGAPVAAELTVFAVDEGVLALTGYRTPDPFASLYEPAGLSVWTVDARGRLAKDAVEPGDDKGGEEGGGGGAALRKNFEAVAFYQPDVLTDARGHAQVEFKLPDSVTRFRVMAVAVTREGLGSGDAPVRTKKPLLVQPLLPRVLRAGDSTQAGVVLHNETERDLDVEVHADITGLSLRDPSDRKVHVKKGAAVEVLYTVNAEHVGNAELRFSAKAGKERDGFEVTRKVLPPTALETVSTWGSTQDVANEGLGELAAVREDVGGLEVKLATSAMAGLETPAQSLVDYAYGCTEQLSSRLVGLAALQRLAKRGLVQNKSYENLASGVISELEKHQYGWGSFGLWSAQDPSYNAQLEAFLTSYALLALGEADKAGFASSPHARDQAKTWLAGYLRRERTKHDELLRDADLALVLFALAQAGSFDASYAAKLFEQRAHLPLMAKVELARAYATQGSSSELKTLLEELSGSVRVTADEAHLEENLGDAFEVLMASSVRATAEFALLLTAHEPDHMLLPRLARWLSTSRELDGTWGSTQETAWGLNALASYAEKTETAAPELSASAFLDQRALGHANLSGPKASARFDISMHDLARAGGRISLRKQGKGKLFYNLRLAYAERSLPSDTRDQGFTIEREYERIRPEALAQGQIKGEPANNAQVGDYIRVTLHVAVPATRRFVVIEDPVPLGLEAVNFALMTSSRASAQALTGDTGPIDHSQLFDDRASFAVTQLEPGLYRYSYLLRATTRGKYVAPPARVEEMYHPETYGRTAGAAFEVSGP